ncbi:MAG: hypothetical protein HY804_02110 [Nitrospinae bacterium]|nr:hypothetical protein [Nitrospinota bacterium]
MYFLLINRIKAGAARETVMGAVSSHVAWIKEQIANGLIAQSGKWGDRGGMLLVRAENIEEAERMANSDPFMKMGLVEYEIDRLFPDVRID